ncbi:MAG TPA: folate-binding protein [Pseudomonadales bacterium]
MPDSWHDLITAAPSVAFSGTLANNAIYPLPHYRFLAVTGPDAEKFLQGQLSCDMRLISETRSGMGAHCNAKGRMLSSFRICRERPDSFLLRLHQSIAVPASSALAKYSVFSKATLAEADSMAAVGLHGPAAHDTLHRLFGELPGHDFGQQQIGEHAMLVCTNAQLAAYEIYADKAQLLALWPQLAASLPIMDQRQQQLIEHNSGLAFVEQGTVEQLIPQMLNYQALPAISFKKGCYTGQEIVARMQYLGKLKRRLYRFRCEADGDIACGDELYINGSTQSCGLVASTLTLDECHQDMLLVLTSEASRQNTLVTATARLSALEALALPYAVETGE